MPVGQVEYIPVAQVQTTLSSCICVDREILLSKTILDGLERNMSSTGITDVPTDVCF
jgi:hypothetical protein